jgi:hypothetical protein
VEVHGRAAQLAPVAGEPAIAERIVVPLPVLDDVQSQVCRGFGPGLA